MKKRIKEKRLKNALRIVRQAGYDPIYVSSCMEDTMNRCVDALEEDRFDPEDCIGCCAAVCLLNH